MKLAMLFCVAWGIALPSLPPASALAQGHVRPVGLPPLGAKPAHTALDEDHDGRTLELKFQHETPVRLEQGRLLSSHAQVRAIDRWLEELGATLAPVFAQSPEHLEALRQAGEARSGRPLHDLNLFFRVTCPLPGQAADVCDELNRHAVVEIAYPIGRVEDPLVCVVPAPPVDTPDFEGFQDYRGTAPVGIDADYANTFSGGLGTGTVMADVETGWTDDHEDIAHKTLDAFVGLPGAFYPWDHGTAVMGELVGADNGSGVRGIVPDADVRLSTHQGNSANIPTAIVNAIDAVGPGDFVILEVQCFGGPPSPFPCEYVDSIFVAVDLATANGIHVVAAAGNGANNLDSPAYGGRFNREVRDSGAILVGASDGSSLNQASFSNYGSRLDAHGWGFNVATAGYGDLFSAGFTRSYTATFSGTSSATPMVTGAAVILNGIERAVHGGPLDPLALRTTLTATGTPQGLGGRIGPRPDLRAAIAALEFPRIDVPGPVAPGTEYRVELNGAPRCAALLLFSIARRETPLFQPPRGFLFLADPVERVGFARMDESGAAELRGKVPRGAPLGTLGYFQALFFLSPVRNAPVYTNYDVLEVR